MFDVVVCWVFGKMIDCVVGIVKCVGMYLMSVEIVVVDDLKVRVKKLYVVEESTFWVDRLLIDDV